MRQYKQNKGFCEDLTEGKFSFPIVHSIRTDTSNQRMLSAWPFASLLWLLPALEAVLTDPSFPYLPFLYSNSCLPLCLLTSHSHFRHFVLLLGSPLRSVGTDVLRQRPTDDAIKAYAVSYMDSKTQSFAYTRAVLRKLEAQARAEIARLGGNEGLSRFLDRMRVPEPSHSESESRQTAADAHVA